jgi:hypothetical protein
LAQWTTMGMNAPIEVVVESGDGKAIISKYGGRF